MADAATYLRESPTGVAPPAGLAGLAVTPPLPAVCEAWGSKGKVP
jgi:hypothetical protein